MGQGMQARSLALVSLVVLSGACGKGTSAPSSGTVAVFDTAADLTSPDHFFDMPFPSDARRTATGAPDFSGLANPLSSSVLDGLRKIAMDRKGAPQMPVAYVRFTGPIATQDPATLVTADKASKILLVDLDGGNALVPVVAQTLDQDSYVPDGVLAVAPRPGFILAPAHKHAVVVMKALGDAQGKPLQAPASFTSLAAGGATGPVADAFAPLWPALDALGVARADVAVATVFTTGDVASDTAALSTKLAATYQADLTNVHVDPDDGAAHDRYCELQAQITYPQFQGGLPPYDTDGLFHAGPDGLPTKTREESAPVTISMPKSPMPAGGYPLVVYFHGTGGVSDAIADRGLWHFETDPTKCPGGALDTWNGKTGCNTKGLGPAYVVAEHQIGMAAAAMPVNPQRFPAGANKDLPEYFNINNVASLRDIFRQGVIEQRILVDALRRLAVAPAVVAACAGMSLPAGETAFHFRKDQLFAQGQSMGAMYANLVSATDERVQATVATGAGGYWTYFILQTTFIDKLPAKLGLILGLPAGYTYMHPTLAMSQAALEPADPMTHMPRLAKSPLPGHPSRPVYQPVGKGDSYFPTSVQDASALAYGHAQAGSVVWPEMQELLGLGGLGGVLPLPVSQNVTGPGGAKSTGVVVQFEGDGIYDPHAIYTQLDAVKYQYGCFYASLLGTGHATVPAPAPLGTPCPN
jgi:hypothetical protein